MKDDSPNASVRGAGAQAGWFARVFGDDPRFVRFVLLVALASAIPMLGVPLTGGLHADQTTLLSAAGVLSFLGGPCHVASTSWFFADPEARAHFLANPMRYVVVPLLLVVGTTAAYVAWAGQAPANWINFGFTVWLLWHYQRQNWGVHSFVTRVRSGGSASRLEEAILKVAVVGGILAGIRKAGFGGGTPVADWADAAFTAGAALTLCLPFMVAWALATVPGLRAAPLRVLSLVATAAFFAPVFAFDNPNNAILPYAYAHGFQYLVFMAYVAGAQRDAGAVGASAAARDAASRDIASHAAAAEPPAQPASFAGRWRPGYGTLAAGTLVIGYCLRVGGNMGLLHKWNAVPLFGFVLGVTMAHFVVDAGIWRLRDEFPRRYVGAAFPFLAPRPR